MEPLEMAASLVAELSHAPPWPGGLKNVGVQEGLTTGVVSDSPLQEPPRQDCSHGHLSELPPEQSHQAHVHEVATGGEGPGHVYLD